MRRINIILLSVTICLGGIVFFLLCRYTHESKKSDVNKKAKETFIKAFGQELKSRDLEEYFSFNYNAKTLLTADMPDSVYFEDESGKHWYRLDTKKHYMNVTDNANVRSLHSSTFRENPIMVDSLNNIWKKCLQDYDIYVKSGLCVSVTGYDRKVKSMSTLHNSWCNISNQVFTIYVGYACEIEIVGYLNYSIWNMMYMEILIYLLLCAVSVYIIYRTSIYVVMKIKSMRQKEVVQMPVIEFVQEMTNTPIRSYIMHDDVIFYAEQKKIEKLGGTKEKLQPQSCQLLELFFRAKDNDYILTDNDIEKELWGNTGTNDRLHKSVGRLRSSIQKVEPSIDIKRNASGYQLLL